MEIKLAASEADFDRCFPIVVQLRPHLNSSGFVEQVKRQEREGYQLVYLEEADQVRAVAGFRIMEMLFGGRFLYVDDLVTNDRDRSKGYGNHLFDWLVAYAKSQDCQQLKLDSGVQRADAHRFYFRQRMAISGYHFVLKLERVSS